MRLLFLCIVLPLYLLSQPVKTRQYAIGEETRYQLTSESYSNDKYTGKTISIADLKVVNDSTRLTEQINWISKVSYSGNDTINLDSIAHRIGVYSISLFPGGNILLPKLGEPEMVGDITDLNTFFVAISPAMNVHKLTLHNPIFTNQNPLRGNFADGIKILKGSDCTVVTQTLLKTNRNYTTVKTEFLPALTNCIVPLIDTVAKKTFEYPNNFQMIRMTGGDKVNFLWGNESFTIITKMDNTDGKILEASMTNTLNLRIRVNASQDLQNFTLEMPYKILRKLTLKLISTTASR